MEERSGRIERRGLAEVTQAMKRGFEPHVSLSEFGRKITQRYIQGSLERPVELHR